LLLAAVIMEVVRRYLRRVRNEGPSASDQLAEFRTLYEQGAISEEEFNSLRSVLGGEIRKTTRKHVTADAPRAAAPRNPHDTPPPAPNRPTPPPETGVRPA
jgi:hypothetical protein